MRTVRGRHMTKYDICGNRDFWLTLAILLLLIAVADAQSISFRSIEPGIDYAHVVSSDGPQSIHVLKILLDSAGGRWPGRRWTTGLGDGRVYGLSTTSSIATDAAAALSARPIAAINGDFFMIARGNFQGDPTGLQIVEGDVVSSSPKRSAVWFDSRGKPLMGLVESRFRVTYAEGAGEFSIGLNEPRGEGNAVLYTPSLAHNPRDKGKLDFSTRTTDGCEFLLEPCDGTKWYPFKVGMKYPARIATVREGGNSPLSKSSVVLSVGDKKREQIPSLKPGDELTIVMETVPDLTGVNTAIGGGELLVSDGELIANPKSKDRHPRSIIGWNQEHLFLIVVDGRAPKVAIGMTYLELGKLAIDFGCTEAINLDGGGSSTLWADGRVLNTPSDGTQRRVANALVLVEVNKNSQPESP